MATVTITYNSNSSKIKKLLDEILSLGASVSDSSSDIISGVEEENYITKAFFDTSKKRMSKYIEDNI